MTCGIGAQTMNEEYIKKQDAIKVLKERASMLNEVVAWHYETLYGAAIMNIPPADVVERKRGEWVWDIDAIDWGIGAWCCSECQSKNDNIPHYPKTNPLIWHGTKYCPECGADMRGNDNE